MTEPDILSPEFEKNPYPFYKSMRDEYPLFFYPPMKTYFISRHADVVRAFKDPVFSSKNYEWQVGPVFGRTVIEMEGKEHAANRSLLTPAFRGRDLQEKFMPVIERNARDLIDKFAARGEADLVNEFFTRFPINVILDMLELSKADHHLFHAWYTSIVDFFANATQDPVVIEAGLRTRRELAEYILPIIAQRRANPGADLLSTLCTAEIDGARMTDDDIRGFVSILLAAGGETTDKALSNLFKNLMEHPDQLERLRNDRSLVPRAVAESLRYSPPTHLIMRTTLAEVEMSGGTVPANALVTCAIGAANRDERKFKDPDRFDILREDMDVERAFTGSASHMSFGSGRHFCVGAVLAKVEMEIATNFLLDAITDIRFAEESPPATRGIFLRAPKTLKIRFSPASTASATP